MTWGFTVEGQPVSWNLAYRIGVKNRPGPRVGQFRTIIKTDAATDYCRLVTLRCREARPSGWRLTEGQVVVIEYRLFLGRHMDADNTMKLVNDGIADALGVDDKWFLPRAMEMTWGHRPKDRRVEIVVNDGGSP